MIPGMDLRGAGAVIGRIIMCIRVMQALTGIIRTGVLLRAVPIIRAAAILPVLRLSVRAGLPRVPTGIRALARDGTLPVAPRGAQLSIRVGEQWVLPGLPCVRIPAARRGIRAYRRAEALRSVTIPAAR